MSLSVLLDYRTEDNKEGTFEVSLFAELFNEMMMRDSGYQIYRAICYPDRAWKPSIVLKENKDGKEPNSGKHILNDGAAKERNRWVCLTIRNLRGRGYKNLF